MKKFIDKRLIINLNNNRKVAGQLIGFDHFMNIVLDKAVEIIGLKEEKHIGKAMISGHLFVGLEYQYWYHKYGLKNLNESLPQALVVWKF